MLSKIILSFITSICFICLLILVVTPALAEELNIATIDLRISKINDIILYPTKNYSQSLKLLLSGRVDAVIGPILGLSYTAKKNND